jgi:hypothetical protein
VSNHSRRRRAAAGVATLAIASLATTPEDAVALSPPDVGYTWVCAGGEWTQSWQGVCFAYEPGAAAAWHFSGTLTNGQKTSIRAGAAVWDQTNGHQFNFILDEYAPDGLSGFPVSMTSAVICGTANAIGCTNYSINGSGQIHVSSMQFRNPASLQHTAAHEFGHALGVGHGADPNSVMRSSSATVLSGNDTEGRCHVYGHSLGLWGGCPCPK